jgi:non-specific serine/threonine protein kinase
VAGRLPAEWSSFVDRRSELAEVTRLLSAARLVTITGVGGVGKTRLAVRAMRQARRAFRDGVWQVELGAVTDGALVEHAVAAALDVRAVRETPTVGLLVNQLAGRELLLVLDNCEHVIDACAALAVALLRSCPQLRILGTSRQRLGVTAETVFLLRPLSTEGPLSTEAGAGRQEGRTSPAVTLFAERAAAASPGLSFTPAAGRLVADICERLDGLPLALELAAARLHTLTVEQLSAGLADRFTLLTVRHATPAHHRRLEDTFDWSFQLCSRAEQRLWMRLSVFAGGFGWDAALAVCTDEQLPSVDLLDVLSGLVDKSIVGRYETAGGEVRYRLLETVREYGQARLRAAEGEDREVVRRRHCDWSLQVAEQFDRDWFGPDQVRLAGRLRDDLPNLRAALETCLATPGLAEAGQRLAAGLRYFWTACGALGEGRLWLERALAAGSTADSAADPAVNRGRAAARLAYTRVLVTQGSAAAVAGAEESLKLARALDDPLLLAEAGYQAGAAILLNGGDLGRAHGLLRQARDRLAAYGGDPLTEAMVTTTLAFTTLYGGDIPAAAQLCAHSCDTCRRHGDQWWLAYSLQASAIVAFAQGDTDDGRCHVEEALQLHDRIGDSFGVVTAIDGIAYAAAAGADPHRGACLLGASRQMWQSIGGDVVKPDLYWRGHPDLITAARSRLGDHKFDAAYDRGRRMSTGDAVRYALGNELSQSIAAPDDELSWAPLTPRERQVADLIGQGLTSRQIAAKLVVSQRTAESHTENILRKLGLTSRTQIATWVVRRKTQPS